MSLPSHNVRPCNLFSQFQKCVVRRDVSVIGCSILSIYAQLVWMQHQWHVELRSRAPHCLYSQRVLGRSVPLFTGLWRLRESREYSENYRPSGPEMLSVRFGGLSAQKGASPCRFAAPPTSVKPLTGLLGQVAAR